MIDKIKNLFNSIINLPSKIISFINHFKNFIINFKILLPIIFVVLVIHFYVFKKIINMFEIHWILQYFIDYFIKFGISLFITYNLIKQKCNKPETNTQIILSKTFVDAIIILLFSIIRNLTFRYIPFIGLINIIPIIGRPIMWSLIFLIESFNYSYLINNQNDYCNTAIGSNLTNIVDKYKNLVLNNLPQIIFLIIRYSIRYYTRSKIRNLTTFRSFKTNNYDYDDYEDEDDDE
jgi:hypothetical protein